MKRTLKDTDRDVRFVIDNQDRQDVWDSSRSDIWTANVYIDGSSESVEAPGLPALGVTVDQAFALAARAVEKTAWLNDLPVPVPEKDYELLCSMLRGIASTWDTPADVPDWRDNEYIRGQLELVIETCRVATDQEFDDGTGDMTVLRDRLTTWIEQEVWK